MRTTMRLHIATVLLLLSTAVGQMRPIDAERSTITVHVFKSGVFSGFADNHEIRAPIASGSLDENAKRVEFVVDSRKLVVLDPNLSADKRQQVQDRMLGPEVLDSSQFHEIRFTADSVRQEGSDRFLVEGRLSLRGTTRPVSLHVAHSDQHYRGETTLKQHDFGIKPISIAGGTVKVKDELKIEFDIVAAPASQQSRAGDR
jgi:polyisoprenoid-binding protein YceI